MNVEKYSHHDPNTRKKLKFKELKNFLDLNIDEENLPLGEANQLLINEKFIFEDCINLFLFEYLCEFEESMPTLFREGDNK